MDISFREFIEKLKQHPDIETDPAKAYIESIYYDSGYPRFSGDKKQVFNLLDTLEINYDVYTPGNSAYMIEDRDSMWRVSPKILGLNPPSKYPCFFLTETEAKKFIKDQGLTQENLRVIRYRYAGNYLYIKLNGVPYAGYVYGVV